MNFPSTARGPRDAIAPVPFMRDHWECFQTARRVAIRWLLAEVNLSDGEIADAMNISATEVFLIRACQPSQPSPTLSKSGWKPRLDAAYSDSTQAASPGEY